MKSRSIVDYIYFGTGLRYLQDAVAGWKIYGEAAVLENVEIFLANVRTFELAVTNRACFKLRKFERQLREGEEGAVLDEEMAKDLRGIMDDIRHTLIAEAGGNVAFIVTDKRLDVQKLLSDVPSLLAPGVFGSLPDIARHDFEQAGRCIAFEMPD